MMHQSELTIGWIVTDQYHKEEKKASENQITCGNLTFLFNQNQRFVNDKIFEENEKYIVILEGVIFNKRELQEKYPDISWFEIIVKLYLEYDMKFPNLLRGTFSGVIYEKDTKKLMGFTNHTGERTVFYSTIKNHIILSSNFNMIIEEMKENNIPYVLDHKAIECMLTYGCMLDETTYIECVKRLMPGTSILIEGNNRELETYHRFDNSKTVQLSDEEVITKLDFYFCQAIKREFEKDKEYNLQSVVDLSGGLDCRVVNYVAKKMGYHNVLNISYSQLKSNEYKATMALYKDLGNDMIFSPLDNPNFIYHIDELVKMNYGLVSYVGTTGLCQIVSNLNLDKCGLEHGGLLGEMKDGAFPGSDYISHTKPTRENGQRFTNVLKNNRIDDAVIERFENTELYNLSVRGLLGGLNSHLIRQQYTDYFSPFEDVDFYDFFLSIPLEQRVKRKILQQWVGKCYPEAFQIIEDKNMCRPIDPRWKKTLHYLYYGTKGKVIQLLGKKIPWLLKNSMNPFEYWYLTNGDIKEFINSYYEKNIHIMEPYDELKQMCSQVFYEGKPYDKTIVMTVLSAMKQYLK